jgi:hypothetical protein
MEARRRIELVAGVGVDVSSLPSTLGKRALALVTAPPPPPPEEEEEEPAARPAITWSISC